MLAYRDWAWGWLIHLLSIEILYHCFHWPRASCKAEEFEGNGVKIKSPLSLLSSEMDIFFYHTPETSVDSQAGMYIFFRLVRSCYLFCNLLFSHWYHIEGLPSAVQLHPAHWSVKWVWTNLLEPIFRGSCVFSQGAIPIVLASAHASWRGQRPVAGRNAKHWPSVKD